MGYLNPEERKRKTTRNKEYAPIRLTEVGIAYTTTNGEHYVIQDRWDFWPGTGLWIDRLDKRRRFRGIERLIEAVKHP